MACEGETPIKSGRCLCETGFEDTLRKTLIARNRNKHMARYDFLPNFCLRCIANSAKCLQVLTF